VTDLFNANSRALFGHNEFELDDLINDWTSPGFDLDEVARVSKNEQGEITGYIEVWDITNPHVTKYVWGMMDPDHWDEDDYLQMLTWAETCARERIALAPEGVRVAMSQGTPSQDIRRNQALEAYGFELVRHFFRMQIDLIEPPQPPSLPEGITVGPIEIETELRQVLLAMEDGFSDHWGHVDRPVDEILAQTQHHIENDRDFDPALWFIAKSGREIAGVCRCEAKTVEDPDMGWVTQLCVRKPFRRQGLGMALLLLAFNEFFRRGKPRAGLVVDAASLTNATRLYEKAGMRVTRQYETYEIELRPGVNLSTS
ncbi:MAG: GNAT family N-acetyltransferase, partial [Brevefilum sp.]